LLSPDFPDGIPASSIDVSARQWEQDSRRWKVQISEATAALHAAKNDQQKTELTKRLSDLLNEYFERDLQHREAELAPLEERVRNLRAQLDRRREKKQEIIDLQIKVAVNEADGLGFFSPPAGAPRGSMLPPR
jgi:hypothetical protein